MGKSVQASPRNKSPNWVECPISLGALPNMRPLIELLQVLRPTLEAQVTAGLAETPAVALLGAGQVGKTTLARRIAASWPGPATIFDLEVATDRDALSRTPARLLGHGRVSHRFRDLERS